MKDERSWFNDPDTLLLELKKTGKHWGEVPNIPGYDRMVEISRGGQGVVYRALQRSTNRVVAVKVLLDGSLASEENRLRFQREIELVAKLSHPCIVAVYDSGITPDGRLYYVMEYVEGAPLGSGGDTLLLFVKICDAVQHAHRNGIIHRDLKPGNILVDDNGDPHVLDFGLAKVVSTEPSDVSRTGQFFGSLSWASPEQIETPDEIDIRADVYSLGVLLYHALTGRMPFEPSQNLHETIAAIVSEAPRAIDAGVPGDIKTVVLRCLAKEPERRYQSAGELLADLRHFLAGEPIDAKRDHAWYVLSKTLGRHKVAAALLAAVLALLVTFSVAMAVLYPRALRAEKQAKLNMEQAVNQAAKAEAVRDFLTELIAYSDPFVSSGQQITVRHALDAAAVKIDSRFGDHPLVEAEIRAAMGDAYYHLGLLDEAEEQNLEALSLLEQLPGDRLMTARLLRNMACIDLDRRRLEETEQRLNRAMEIVTAELGEDHVQYAHGLHILAGLRQTQFRLEEAYELFAQSAAVYERHLDPREQHHIVNQLQWAGLLISLRRLDEAVEKLEKVLDVVDERHAPLLSGILFYVGLAEFNRGNLDAADEALQKAMKSQLEIFGKGQSKEAEISTQIGHVRRNQSRFIEAEKQYRRSLEIYADLSGTESSEYASGLWNIGQVLWYQNDLEEAEAYFRQALGIRRKIYGLEHHFLAASVGRLGMIFNEVGQWEKALPFLEEAATLQEKNLGGDHPMAARARALQGECLARLDRFEEAEQLLLDALDTLEKGESPSPVYLNHAYDALIRLYLEWKKPAQAKEFQDRQSSLKNR